MGTIKKLKKIVRICVANQWIDKDPFMSFKVKIRETNRSYLLQDELDKIIALKFTAERLATVRDILVPLLLHRLAYADVHGGGKPFNRKFYLPISINRKLYPKMPF